MENEKPVEHIKACAQTEKIPCPANWSIHSEAPDEHWWSGWPGAFCMKCGSEDKDEICIADVCVCPCHDEFWESFAEAVSSVGSGADPGWTGEEVS